MTIHTPTDPAPKRAVWSLAGLLAGCLGASDARMDVLYSMAKGALVVAGDIERARELGRIYDVWAVPYDLVGCPATDIPVALDPALVLQQLEAADSALAMVADVAGVLAGPAMMGDKLAALEALLPGMERMVAAGVI